MPDEGGSERPALSPEEGEDAWRTAVILLGSVKDSELLDTRLAPEELLYRLYATVGVGILPPRPVRAACRCSAARSLRIMASFPMTEVRDFAEGGKVAMTCEFCRAVFSFTLDEIAAAAESLNSAGKEST
jgi:molecular chaperone Hsp33